MYVCMYVCMYVHACMYKCLLNQALLVPVYKTTSFSLAFLNMHAKKTFYFQHLIRKKSLFWDFIIFLGKLVSSCKLRLFHRWGNMCMTDYYNRLKPVSVSWWTLFIYVTCNGKDSGMENRFGRNAHVEEQACKACMDCRLCLWVIRCYVCASGSGGHFLKLR